MTASAEKRASKILKGPSSYNRLFDMLGDDQEKCDLLHRAILEHQMLTILQCVWHAKELTCQAWRNRIYDWLINLVKDYERLYGQKEAR